MEGERTAAIRTDQRGQDDLRDGKVESRRNPRQERKVRKKKKGGNCAVGKRHRQKLQKNKRREEATPRKRRSTIQRGSSVQRKGRKIPDSAQSDTRKKRE